MAAPPGEHGRHRHPAQEPDRRLAVRREDPVALLEREHRARLHRLVVPEDRVRADAALAVVDDRALVVRAQQDEVAIEREQLVRAETLDLAVRNRLAVADDAAQIPLRRAAPGSSGGRSVRIFDARRRLRSDEDGDRIALGLVDGLETSPASSPSTWSGSGRSQRTTSRSRSRRRRASRPSLRPRPRARGARAAAGRGPQRSPGRSTSSPSSKLASGRDRARRAPAYVYGEQFATSANAARPVPLAPRAAARSGHGCSASAPNATRMKATSPGRRPSGRRPSSSTRAHELRVEPDARAEAEPAPVHAPEADAPRVDLGDAQRRLHRVARRARAHAGRRSSRRPGGSRAGRRRRSPFSTSLYVPSPPKT